MRRLAVWLLVLVLVLVAQSARAGELGFSWDSVDYPHPVSYNIYRLPDVSNPIAQTVSLDTVVASADNCQAADYAITAVGNPGGESALSAPVTSIARPTISGIQFNDAGVDRITGTNYPVDAKVFVDAVEAVNVNRINCQTIEIPTTIGTPTSVEVRNVQPGGTLTVSWVLPPPVSPGSFGAN